MQMGLQNPAYRSVLPFSFLTITTSRTSRSLGGITCVMPTRVIPMPGVDVQHLVGVPIA